MGNCDVTKPFKEVHLLKACQESAFVMLLEALDMNAGRTYGQCVSRLPGAADELGKHIVLNLDPRRGIDDPRWYREQQSQRNAKEDCADASVCWPASHRSNAKSNCDDVQAQVPPFGNFSVESHHPVMNVYGQLGIFHLFLVAKTSDQGAETKLDVIPMVQSGVRYDGAVNGKEVDTSRHTYQLKCSCRHGGAY